MSGRTVTVVGVDEAGLSPYLGPLVISASAFTIPVGWERHDLWKILGNCVTRENWLRRFKVLVDDSKKLYSRTKGIGVLEEGVLSFLQVAHGPCRKLSDLLDQCGVGLCDMSHYPWYEISKTALPLKTSVDLIDDKARKLTEGLRQAGVEFNGFCVHPVFEYEYNSDIDLTDNKSLTLFNKTAAVLKAALDTYPGDLLIFCDRQGGRSHYTRLWAEAFPGSSFKIIVQNAGLSHYIIKWSGRRIEVVFAEKSDQKFLPVALASMMSKFIREVFMKQLNAFWLGHLPELKPTAGYPNDAKRFLKEVEPMRQRLGIPNELMIRKR